MYQVHTHHIQFYLLGDVILTGTPPGVGIFMKPPQQLQVGDLVECAVQAGAAARMRTTFSKLLIRVSLHNDFPDFCLQFREFFPATFAVSPRSKCIVLFSAFFDFFLIFKGFNIGQDK